MKKFTNIFVRVALLCLVFILLYGCVPNSDSKDPTEDNKNVDATIHMLVPSPSPILPKSFTIMFVQLQQYGSKLNVRDNPATNNNIIGKLEHGERVEVTSKQGRWACIHYNGSTGYIHADYLVQDEPLALMPPMNTSPGEVYLNVYKEKRTLELWSNNE